MADPILSLDKLLGIVRDMVRKDYERNTDPNYDMCPALFAVDTSGQLTVAVLAGDGHPHMMLKMALAQLRPTMFVFAVATWMTQGDENGNKIGPREEGVVITAEDGEVCIVEGAKVKRAPLPVLEEFIKADHSSGRMVNLLTPRPKEN